VCQGELNATKIDELSYSPSQKELPFFRSLYRSAHKDNYNTLVSRDEAIEVLSLSRLSRKKLDMILDMSMKKGSTSLNKNQFFVAVRLIQFRQNKETVRNLKLTVPDDVDLKPPFFKGFLEAKPCDYKIDPSLGNITQDESEEQDMQCSNSSSSKYCTMEKEIVQLKEELQSTREKLHLVTKDNSILRKEEIRVSHKLVQSTKPKYEFQDQTKNYAAPLNFERPRLNEAKQEEYRVKFEESKSCEIPRGRRRSFANRHNEYQGRYKVVSVPKMSSDDSLISDITEDTQYKYYPLIRSRSVECLGLDGYRGKSDNYAMFNRYDVHKRSKSFSNANDISDGSPSTKSGLRSLFRIKKKKKKKLDNFD